MEVSYLLLLGVELDELLKEDDEQGDTDHAYETDAHPRETAQMCLWIVVAVAHRRHCHKTHPQWIDEITEVLGVIFERIRLFTGLDDKCGYYTYNNHHKNKSPKRSLFQFSFDHEV